MKRVLVKISFDGTSYHGWQSQKNGLTVQEVFQKAVEKVLKKPTNVTGCSRTDSGVHAKEFCCHIDCDDTIPPSAFLLGVNSCLPSDISVIDCTEAPSDFHARYKCVKKNYIYYFYTGKHNPFYERYALHIEKNPDLALANDFCKRIIGKHDFYGFSSSGRSTEDTVRTIYDCQFYKKNDFYCFDITGDGFLYNMVRILAGSALCVGYGNSSPTTADDVFSTRDRSLAGDTLSPKGLFLNKVYY